MSLQHVTKARVNNAPVCVFGVARGHGPGIPPSVALDARTLSRREEKQILLPQGRIRMTCPAAAGAHRSEESAFGCGRAALRYGANSGPRKREEI